MIRCELVKQTPRINGLIIVDYSVNTQRVYVSRASAMTQNRRAYLSIIFLIAL